MARYYCYRIGFRGTKQTPWFLLWIEYFDPICQGYRYDLDYQVEFARIIYRIG